MSIREAHVLLFKNYTEITVTEDKKPIVAIEINPLDPAPKRVDVAKQLFGRGIVDQLVIIDRELSQIASAAIRARKKSEIKDAE